MKSPTNLDTSIGITVGSFRSRQWRVRSGANKPEIFIEREGLEKVAHLSLHESGKWHLKIKNNKVFEWPQPKELHPGYTRAVVIVQTPETAFIDVPSPFPANLIDLPNTNTTAQFNIFIERPGSIATSWPGKSSGAKLVARLPLANNAGTFCIVLQRAPMSILFKFPIPNEQVAEQIHQSASRKELFATLLNREPDGSLALIDLRLPQEQDLNNLSSD